VFPLSPFFLGEKVVALGRYFSHRGHCLWYGHGDDVEASVASAERRHGLPRGLLGAVVEVESKGNAHRISAAGAMGPAQLTAATAELLGVVDPYDPATAIDGGARYLAAQLKRFGDTRLAVAAYNAGPGAIRGQVPRNGETEHYVAKVMAEYARRAPVVQTKATLRPVLSRR